MQPPIRILYDEYGRTGNRFFAYLDSLGWAIVHNKKVVILFPEKILQDFDAFRKSRYVSLPLWGRGKLVWRIMRKLFFYNVLIQKFYKTRLSHSVGFYAGWGDLRESHQYWPQAKPQIQALFVPNDDVKLPIDRVFTDVKFGGGKIVGVHIRREDYKTAYGGIYYYDDEVFIGYMKQMEALLPGCQFYISSNEKISPKYKELFQLVETPVHSAVGDLYALSQCDYIIGPPSTFNCWASFVGDVPLFTMFKPNNTLTVDSFVVMRDEIYQKRKQSTENKEQ